MSKKGKASIESIDTRLTGLDAEEAAEFMRALKIQNSLDSDGLIEIPTSVSKKLHAIPDLNPRSKTMPWRSVAAVAALLAMVLIGTRINIEEPSYIQVAQYDAAQIEREIAIAFSYIDKAAGLSRKKTAETLGGSFEYAMSRGLSLEINPVINNHSAEL